MECYEWVPVVPVPGHAALAEDNDRDVVLVIGDPCLNTRAPAAELEDLCIVHGVDRVERDVPQVHHRAKPDEVICER